jgi:predicted nucleic acid-binding protein
VWVDFLRTGGDGPAAALGELLERETVFVCGPVAAELLAGTAAEQVEDVWDALASFSWATLDQAAWREVGTVAGALRRAGASVPLTDVEIAVAASRAGAGLWTRDTDFERIQEALPTLELFTSAP